MSHPTGHQFGAGSARRAPAPDGTVSARRSSGRCVANLWKHRSIYVAPLIAAGVVVFGLLISTIRCRIIWLLPVRSGRDGGA